MECKFFIPVNRDGFLEIINLTIVECKCGGGFAGDTTDQIINLTIVECKYFKYVDKKRVAYK